jgi:putative transposase
MRPNEHDVSPKNVGSSKLEESGFVVLSTYEERSMKRSKFSEEQIAYALRQAESGTPVADVCRQLGVSEATDDLWKKKYAHLGVSELRRLRQVEDEHRRLKQRVADLTLDQPMLREALRTKG